MPEEHQPDESRQLQADKGEPANSALLSQNINTLFGVVLLMILAAAGVVWSLSDGSERKENLLTEESNSFQTQLACMAATNQACSWCDSDCQDTNQTEGFYPTDNTATKDAVLYQKTETTGLCPPGQNCTSTTTIYLSGRLETDGKTYQLTKDQRKRVANIIAAAPHSMSECTIERAQDIQTRYRLAREPESDLATSTILDSIPQSGFIDGPGCQEFEPLEEIINKVKNSRKTATSTESTGEKRNVDLSIQDVRIKELGSCSSSSHNGVACSSGEQYELKVTVINVGSQAFDDSLTEDSQVRIPVQYSDSTGNKKATSVAVNSIPPNGTTSVSLRITQSDNTPEKAAVTINMERMVGFFPENNVDNNLLEFNFQELLSKQKIINRSQNTDDSNDLTSRTSLQAEYRSEQYGFSFSYPDIYPEFTQQTSDHQSVEELNIRRLRASAADPPSPGALELKTNNVTEKQGYPSIHLHVTDLEKYFYVNKSAGVAFEYNAATGDWYQTSPPGKNRQILEPKTVTVGDRTGYRVEARDAGFVYDGIAIPYPERDVMVEIGFTTSPSTKEEIARSQMLESFQFPTPGNTTADTTESKEYSYLLVRGHINLQNDEAEFRSFTSVETTPERAEAIGQQSGNYTLMAYDDNGEVVDEVSFEPSRAIADPGGPTDTASFTVPVRMTKPIKKVSIRSPDGDVMATKSASKNSPQVEVIHPNGGESIRDQTTIRWEGSDPDGDQLEYTVMYSNDGGETYKALETSWQQTELEVDSLAGTDNGLIKVRASDGFNTTVDRSDNTFTVSNRKPQVRLLEPEPGTTKENRRIFFDLDGSAYDPEDGHLSGDSLVWSSNKDGILTTGERDDLWADEISLGQHIITLKAIDSDGAVSKATTSITVLPDE
jgi:hypothetical protein